MSEDWDWPLQQNQTAYTVAKLGEESGLDANSRITLELQFQPGAGADEAAFRKVLTTFGYSVAEAEAGGLDVSIADIPFTFESVWTHEERTTKMALGRGYRPDGWGFWEP